MLNQYFTTVLEQVSDLSCFMMNHSRNFSKSAENPVEVETEVRHNFEAIFLTCVESAFESVLTLERGLVDVALHVGPVKVFLCGHPPLG